MKTEGENEKNVQRKDMFYYQLEDLNIIPEFNVRQDFGDIDGLAESIKSNGIKNPLKCFKKDGKVYITNGHRRLMALEKLKSEGVEVLVPVIFSGKNYTEEESVFDLIVTNDGLRLNPVEESEVVKRLVNYGYTTKQISNKVGYPEKYIDNLLKLSELPKKIKDLICENVISSTTAVKILRETENFEEAMSIIESAMQVSSQDGGKVKVTEKTINKAKGKTNSFSAIRKAIKLSKKRTVRMDKVDFYNTLKSIVEGEYTLEYILSEIYEPEVEKPKNKRKKKQINIDFVENNQ